jgi:hypothetical protein
LLAPSRKDIYESIPSLGAEPKEPKGSREMKNKQKYNRNSKIELPKRYKKNKK